MTLSEKPTYVYWIRHVTHTDIRSQGYVGITTHTVSHRFKQHLNYHKRINHQSRFNSALKKYHPLGELVVETLCLTEKSHALFLENQLRPDDCIGWNICKGGQVGLPELTDEQIVLGRKKSVANAKPRKGKDHPCYGKSQSEESNIARSEKMKDYYRNNPDARIAASLLSKGRKHTEEARANMSAVQKVLKANTPKWEMAKTNKDAWVSAQIIYEVYYLLGQCGNFKLKNFLGVPIQTTKTIHKMLRDGWIPAKDSKWIEFYEQNKTESDSPVEEFTVFF